MRDPGLQPERTALAWRRTALAMLANGALLVRGSIHTDSRVLFMVSMAIVVASLSTFGIATWRHRELMQHDPPRAPHASLMMLVAGIVLVSTAVGVFSIVRP
jgi:uncharacterized membrane protein YidH (DUF202 family)